jgi:hypothetical protein
MVKKDLTEETLNHSLLTFQWETYDDRYNH